MTTSTYSSSRGCPKCGNLQTGDVYHEANDCKYARRECRGVDGKEHIKRHCQRCHYEWAELCTGEQQ